MKRYGHEKQLKTAPAPLVPSSSRRRPPPIPVTVYRPSLPSESTVRVYRPSLPSGPVGCSPPLPCFRPHRRSPASPVRVSCLPRPSLHYSACPVCPARPGIRQVCRPLLLLCWSGASATQGQHHRARKHHRAGPASVPALTSRPSPAALQPLDSSPVSAPLAHSEAVSEGRTKSLGESRQLLAARRWVSRQVPVLPHRGRRSHYTAETRAHRLQPHGAVHGFRRHLSCGGGAGKRRTGCRAHPGIGGQLLIEHGQYAADRPGDGGNRQLPLLPCYCLRSNVVLFPLHHSNGLYTFVTAAHHLHRNPAEPIPLLRSDPMQHAVASRKASHSKGWQGRRCRHRAAYLRR